MSVQINTSYGPLNIPATAILNFKANPEVTKLKSKGLDGNTRHAVIPDSWKGSISPSTASTTSSTTSGDASRRITSPTAPPEPATIIERIQEQDGTRSALGDYEGVVLTLDDAGDYAADKKVEQTFTLRGITQDKGNLTWIIAGTAKPPLSGIFFTKERPDAVTPASDGGRPKSLVDPDERRATTDFSSRAARS